jgi:cystathionine beta-lyase/cystathionine gamma-synthase
MTDKYRHIETKLIHAGEPEPRIDGAVSMPIFQTAMFLSAGEQSYHDIRYLRLNNTPNHVVLHDKLAALENAEAALVTASGMAAISTALLTLLSSGDHFLAQNCLYGGTNDLVTKELGEYGIEHDFIDASAPETWESKLRPSTKLVYIETIANPLMDVPNLKAVVEFAKANGLVTMIDNTFASPMNFRPAEWGIDLSLHSGTKYLNGHSDLVAGAVIGKAELVRQITHRLNHLGGTLDPHACFLLHRGIKTLAVRVGYQNASALALAKFLEKHPAVRRVNYPGLASHPGHAVAKELFNGFGGMLSFEIDGGVDVAERFMVKTQLPVIAPSLGGVETLLTRPAITSHSGLTPEERERVGISDGLIRVSVGIEHREELIADFAQAFEG